MLYGQTKIDLATSLVWTFKLFHIISTLVYFPCLSLLGTNIICSCSWLFLDSFLKYSGQNCVPRIPLIHTNQWYTFQSSCANSYQHERAPLNVLISTDYNLSRTFPKLMWHLCVVLVCILGGIFLHINYKH